MHAWVVVSHASSMGQSAGDAQPLLVSVGPVSVGPVSVGPVSVGPVSVGPVSAGAVSPVPMSVVLVSDPVSRRASAVASGPGILRPSVPESEPGMATVGFPPHAVTIVRHARRPSLATAEARWTEPFTKK